MVRTIPALRTICADLQALSPPPAFAQVLTASSMRWPRGVREGTDEAGDGVDDERAGARFGERERECGCGRD
eukprot:754969-Hanusia_phi.AAC.2